MKHPALNGVNRAYRLNLAREYIKGHNVLDLGCSDGAFLSLMYDYDATIIGIDNNKKRIEIAKNYGNAFIGDALNQKLLLSYKFDTIVCTDTIEHVGNNKAAQNYENILLFINNINRLINPKGRLILSFPLKPFGTHPQYLREIPKFYGFKIIKKQYLTHNLPLDNETIAPKIEKNKVLSNLLILTRPFILYILLLLGKIKKSEVFIVYEKTKL